MPSFWVRGNACRDWWFDRSGMEKCLIITLTATIIIVVILSSVGNYTASKQLCQSSECLKEASRILAYINPDVNPCENFYKFTCYNFNDNAGEDEKISLDQYKKAQLLDIYKEDIKISDHRMVKAAKKLFQSCTNEANIEKDGVRTLQEALKIAGGWPVLDVDWKEEDFDWKQSTYKLRELGYEHSMFLELSLILFPDESDKFIFQVSSPDADDYRYGLFNIDKPELMTDIAEIIKKGNRTQIKAEMEEVYKFWQKLQDYDHPFYIRSYKKYTVEEYEKFTSPFNWLEFINKVAGPTATIAKNEYVLFPDPQNLTSWLDFIDKTPKRIQANYMMWKVVEGAIPYLNRDLRYGKSGLIKKQSHESFCLSETEKRFYPSPISVINDRRHITAEKRHVVANLLESMRSELRNIMENSTWIEKSERNRTVERINSMKFIIAQPADYLTDTILDDLDVDMITVRNETFLNLISQANRNIHSWVYSQIRQPLAESYLWKLHIRFDNGQPGYNSLDNSLFIPGVAIQDLLFHHKRPHYVNYGSMSALLGYHVSSVVSKFWSRSSVSGGWSNKTKDEYTKRIQCLSDSINDYHKEFYKIDALDDVLTVFITGGSKNVYYAKEQLGIQIAYAAYDKWLAKNGKELQLVGMDYTPKQLFWISAGITFCGSKVNRDVGRVKPEVILSTFGNTHNFAQDFNCPAMSTMNPTKKCQIFS